MAGGDGPGDHPPGTRRPVQIPGHVNGEVGLPHDQRLDEFEISPQDRQPQQDAGQHRHHPLIGLAGQTGGGQRAGEGEQGHADAGQQAIDAGIEAGLQRLGQVDGEEGDGQGQQDRAGWGQPGQLLAAAGGDKGQAQPDHRIDHHTKSEERPIEIEAVGQAFGDLGRQPDIESGQPEQQRDRRQDQQRHQLDAALKRGPDQLAPTPAGHGVGEQESETTQRPCRQGEEGGQPCAVKVARRTPPTDSGRQKPNTPEHPRKPMDHTPPPKQGAVAGADCVTSMPEMTHHPNHAIRSRHGATGSARGDPSPVAASAAV